MEKNMIKAIVFDLGGVLIDLDIERCKKAFREDLGYSDIDEILDACHQKGFYSDLEEGKISEDEFRSLILAQSRPDAGAEDVDRAMWALLTGVEPYKIGLLRELAGRYDLYLLSNNNSISMCRCREIFSDAGLPMDEAFKALFISYQMKMLKPSPAIYGSMIASLGLRPEEILFIDDSEANVKAASKAGINTLPYVPGTDLAAAIHRSLSALGDSGEQDADGFSGCLLADGKNHGDLGRC